mgnify:CR=1 FL=1
MSDEIALGSVGVTEESLEFLRSVSIQRESGDETDSKDCPFDSIANAFKFAFSYGYSNDKRLKKKAPAGNIAPRAFNARDFEVILSDTCKEEKLSLGALASEYAEAGIEVMIECTKNGESLLNLIR